jgi:hypothetical protein
MFYNALISGYASVFVFVFFLLLSFASCNLDCLAGPVSTNKKNIFFIMIEPRVALHYIHAAATSVYQQHSTTSQHLYGFPT